MDGSPETYRVLSRPGPAPETDDGRRVLASLLGVEEDRLTTFATVKPPGTPSSTHRHTSAVAAGVVSGAVTFVFGADGVGRVDLGPGDYLWIGENVVHDEETGDGVELIIGHLEPFETLTR